MIRLSWNPMFQYVAMLVLRVSATANTSLSAGGETGGRQGDTFADDIEIIRDLHRHRASHRSPGPFDDSSGIG